MYETIFNLCGHICHQDPARSLFIGGVQFPVCFRCMGLYGALVSALAVLALARFSSTQGRFRDGGLFLAAAVLLVLADVWIVQPAYFNNATRFASGVFLGGGVGFFLWQCLAGLRASWPETETNIKIDGGVKCDE